MSICFDEAVCVSGERTYARTIERALQEMVSRAKVRGIEQLAGSGLWTGNLTQMRGDAPVVRERQGVYRARKPRTTR